MMQASNTPTDAELLRAGLVRKAALTPKANKNAELRRLEALEIARSRYAMGRNAAQAKASAVSDETLAAVRAAYEAANNVRMPDGFIENAIQSQAGLDVYAWIIEGWFKKAEQMAAEKAILGAAIVGERDAGRRRQLRVKIATPRWADFAKIAEIIAERDRVSAATGVPHHVDHIYPLAGRWVCGLHVHTNMRVIPAEENLRKNASMPLDDGAVFI